MASPPRTGESNSDYSGSVRSSARHVLAAATHVHGLASAIRTAMHRSTAPVQIKLPEGAVDDDGGLVMIDGHPVAEWIATIVLWARRNTEWKGIVTSGYRTVAEQRAACQGLCGNPEGCPGRCAKPGSSNHQYKTFPRGAVDVTDYATFGRVVKRYPGEHTLKNDLPADLVHFSYDGH